MRPLLVVHPNAGGYHVASLTLQGDYTVGPAYGPNKAYRYLDVGITGATQVKGLGKITWGCEIRFKGPGLVQLPPAGARGGFGFNNYNFPPFLITPNSGQFNASFLKKVSPPTKGYALAETFKITGGTGPFAGAQGGGTVEFKFTPKVPLTANAPPTATYQGKATAIFHFTKTTVLT